ncbi:hypothetical protein [Accumulibacter sp.]|uniref:hypothetical protein n=1 Tax=Accumulibacter sp. TaxID=2053492 RepID=UPI0026049DB3|nr:hypothetical protein [Accumulibacter sp.]
MKHIRQEAQGWGAKITGLPALEGKIVSQIDAAGRAMALSKWPSFRRASFERLNWSGAVDQWPLFHIVSHLP